MRLIVRLLALLVAFQGCQKSSYYSLQPGDASGAGGAIQLASGGGSGIGFEGHISRYLHLDPAHPCSDLGADGKPLPNGEILVRGGSTPTAEFVRSQCADLAAPQPLPVSSLAFASDGSSLTYQGVAFTAQSAVGDFDVIAASCPTGLAPRPNPARVNLLQSSQDLTAPAWGQNPGLSVSLAGSLAGLPGFELLHNDPANLANWVREFQMPTLVAGKTYAFTFFGKPGTVNGMNVVAYDMSTNTTVLAIQFNLATGATGSLFQSSAAYNPSAVTRAFSGGFVGTFYFTYQINGPDNIGLTPLAFGTGSSQPVSLGDSAYATAVQLEDVSDFCQ